MSNYARGGWPGEEMEEQKTRNVRESRGKKEEGK